MNQRYIYIFIVFIFVSKVYAQQALRIKAVGDLLLADALAGIYSKNYLRDVEDVMQAADLTFANIEGGLCDVKVPAKCKNSGSKNNCYAFRMPTRYIDDLLRAGIDMVSLANNHVFDYGTNCAQQTYKTLMDYGIFPAGTKDNPGDDDYNTVAEIDINGLKVALVAFHTTSSWNRVISLNTLSRAKKIVKRATKRNDLVIISFHGGGEGPKYTHVPHGEEYCYGSNRGDLRKFTHAMIDLGADLILGHGPHVPRAMELYKGKLIVYSLGNFATFGRFSMRTPLDLGMIVDVSLDQDGNFLKGELTSTIQKKRSSLKIDQLHRASALVASLSAEDFPNSKLKFSSDGQISINTID
ncbi:MAG: CapA family protein [Bacteriovoracaceae bacterium]|nr:CapA family protein [Bacteriovoracaceae bacterium]